MDIFKELVKKKKNVKAKATLWPRTYAQDTYQHCLQGNKSELDKAKSQSGSWKNSRAEESKTKPQNAKATAFLMLTSKISKA